MVEEILDEESKQKIVSMINSEIKRERSLGGVLDSVLNSSSLFLYLRLFLDKDKGALLGRMNYYRNDIVLVNYGLSLNFEGFPGKLDLFSYEHFLGYLNMDRENLRFGKSFPDFFMYEGFSGYPLGEELLKGLDEVLENPFESVVELRKKPCFKLTLKRRIGDESEKR